jgi:S1-C subfamily serine protease
VSGRRFAALPLLLAAGCGGHHERAARPAILQVKVGREASTAFAFGPGRLITVAHVLAGRRPGERIRLSGGRSARIVAVDERDDLAELAVPGLDGPLPRLGGGRGSAVVLVLRGGRVRALPATIRRSITARIRAPDGGRIVRRPALELRADIEPGDSGAPVMTRDGRIAGVVFAQSDLHDHTAYAVAATALGRL